MSGIQFLVDDTGRRTAVVIDLDTNGDLWEDFQDVSLARDREDEPRETLEDVRRSLVDEAAPGSGPLQRCEALYAGVLPARRS